MTGVPYSPWSSPPIALTSVLLRAASIPRA